MRRTIAVPVFAATIAIACSDYEGNEIPPADAGVGTADAGDATPDAAPAIDAGGRIDAAPSGPCTMTGLRIRPTVAYNASPAGGLGQVCNPSAVLEPGNGVAGLDRAAGTDVDGTDLTMIDGQKVTGCVGADFPSPVRFASIAITAGPAGDACGARPCDKNNADGCGTGHTIAVFAGATRETVKLKAAPELAAGLSEKIIPLDGTIKSVIVCRIAWSPRRDDVAVDAIEGICP
ncbi:MAG: hypothetical protein U0270_44805 [Labilithrix sp.]